MATRSNWGRFRTRPARHLGAAALEMAYGGFTLSCLVQYAFSYSDAETNRLESRYHLAFLALMSMAMVIIFYREEALIIIVPGSTNEVTSVLLAAILVGLCGGSLMSNQFDTPDEIHRSRVAHCVFTPMVVYLWYRLLASMTLRRKFYRREIV